MNSNMRYSFSLAFIFLGLSILFSIREYIPVNKTLFTYFMMGLVFLLLPNYNIINSFKIYTKYPKINCTLFLLVLFLSISSFILYGFNPQSMYLFIVMYILLSLLSIPNEKLEKFYLAVFVVSIITTFIAYITTSSYMLDWTLMTNNHRVYVGDTKNPNIISWVSMISVILWFIFLFKYKIKGIWRLVAIIFIPLSFHMYILSFSKSSIIGLGLVITFYIYSYRDKIFSNKKTLLQTIAILIISIVVFEQEIYNAFILLLNTVHSLFTGEIIGGVMSASVRYELFSRAFELWSIDNVMGYGMNTFRMDSPFLQMSIDFGNFLGLIMLYIFAIYPLYIIYKTQINFIDKNSEVVIVLYLFLYPNFFFHGTPYSYFTWLPVLIFYKFIFMDKNKRLQSYKVSK